MKDEEEKIVEYKLGLFIPYRQHLTTSYNIGIDDFTITPKSNILRIKLIKSTFNN